MMFTYIRIKVKVTQSKIQNLIKRLELKQIVGTYILPSPNTVTFTTPT